jgi:hypothetical protein
MGELRVQHAPSNRPEWLGLRTFPFRKTGPDAEASAASPRAATEATEATAATAAK